MPDITLGRARSPAPRRRPWIVEALAFGAIYVALAMISASTALVQINAAAVWIPSGFGIGLLITRGLRLWPAVALGSFIFNLTLVLLHPSPPSLVISSAVALLTAIGNTGEAVLGAMLARRFATDALYVSRTRTAAAFALLVAPIPPLVSTLIGVTSSWAGGVQASGTVLDVALTWYVGNYVGIMVFTGLTLLILNRAVGLPPRLRLAEALALTLCLCFVGQAICGFFLTGWLGDWLKSYMAVPLILWACFRFEVAGGSLALSLITTIAVFGTLRGYVAFPSKSPWMALIYLQVFIGMLSVISLVVSAAIAELKAIRATLEDRVRLRTKEIESLMREREVFTVLVAHDLQSPLYGLRNALRASAAALSVERLSGPELGSALAVMEETCSTLVDRVESVLLSGRDLVVDAEAKRRFLTEIVARIASAHGISIDTPSARLVRHGDSTLSVACPDDVEHIVDALVDNALRYSPDDTPIEIAVFQYGRSIEIHVTDRGPGLSPAARQSLFRGRAQSSPPDPRRPGAGLGLYLASERAAALGGRLTYAPAHPQGSTFKLVVPA